MNDLSRLALAGLLSGGALLTFSGCRKEEAPKPAPGAPAKPALQPAYSDVHDCAGLNSCKGLGGCKVDDARLAELATKRGISLAQAGQAHDCKGMNECKGLGGCKVDQPTFDELKKKQGG